MKKKYRNFLLALSTALLVSCGTPLSFEHGQSVPPPSIAPIVRAPAVGQEWTYIQRDMFQGQQIGVLTERVASIGNKVVINRQLNSTQPQQSLLLDIALGHTTRESGQLASEVQGPWGLLLIDPSWGKILEFNPGIPAWPQNLLNEQSQTFNSRYNYPGMFGASLRWESNMKIFGWERVVVPAGQFTALHFENHIVYSSPDPSKSDCRRTEAFWFAPEIGRWVVKETSGSCMQVEQTNAAANQSSYRWELSSWK